MLKSELPKIGLKIKSILDSPNVKINDHVFCGTWLGGVNTYYELIGITWQNVKTGVCLTNEEFLNML